MVVYRDSNPSQEDQQSDKTTGVRIVLISRVWYVSECPASFDIGVLTEIVELALVI